MGLLWAVVGFGMATKQPTTRKDFTQTALDVVRQATGEETAPAPAKNVEGGRRPKTPQRPSVGTAKKLTR